MWWLFLAAYAVAGPACGTLDDAEVAAYLGTLDDAARTCLTTTAEGTDADAARASRILAQDAQTRGDHPEWARHATRAATLDPTDATLALELATWFSRDPHPDPAATIRWGTQAVEHADTWTDKDIRFRSLHASHRLRSLAAMDALAALRGRVEAGEKVRKKDLKVAEARAQDLTRAWYVQAEWDQWSTEQPRLLCVKAGGKEEWCAAPVPEDPRPPARP